MAIQVYQNLNNKETLLVVSNAYFLLSSRLRFGGVRPYACLNNQLHINFLNNVVALLSFTSIKETKSFGKTNTYNKIINI